MPIDQIAQDIVSKKIIQTLVDNLGPVLKSTYKLISRSFNDDFGHNIEQTLVKCSTVRTILNRDQSIPLSDIYVNLNFKSGNEIVDDYELIDRVKSHRRVILIGTGGGGKTIFMRYLWMSLLESGGLRIPVFIELRRFNGNTDDQFFHFLFRSTTTSESADIGGFRKAVEAGHFSFILDGFDEINHELRDIVERSIIDTSFRAPNSIFVVSSRDDERFDGWESFGKFTVLPMTMQKTCELIQKIDFDKKVKSKFIGRIKSDLFRTHESFLSSPLLATMMLLTFDQFADIPEKVHLFYEQAFDTLFARHDATKEAFKRKSYSSLPIDQFKEILSLFCLSSYYGGAYEFTDTTIFDYINSALRLSAAKVKPDLFFRDLIENVCILQRDGLKIVFSHRSFQEFFCAYALTKHVSHKMNDIMPKLILGRWSDSVFKMALDMNAPLVEREFLIPLTKRVIDRLNEKSDETPFIRYAYTSEQFIMCSRSTPRTMELYAGTLNGDVSVLVQCIRQYPDSMKAFRPSTPATTANLNGIKDALKASGQKMPSRRAHPGTVMRPIEFIVFDKTISPRANEDVFLYERMPVLGIDFFKLRETSIAAEAQSKIDAITQFAKHLMQRADRREKTIDQIFQ